MKKQWMKKQWRMWFDESSKGLEFKVSKLGFSSEIYFLENDDHTKVRDSQRREKQSVPSKVARC